MSRHIDTKIICGSRNIMNKCLFFLIGFLLLCTACTNTQTNSIHNSDSSLSKTEEMGKSKPLDYVSVPFKYYYNEILFQAGINNSKPLWFLLDTGCSGFSINERTAIELGLKTGSKIEAGDYYVGEGNLFETSIEDVSFNIQDIDMSINDNIIAHSFELIEAVLGHHIDGVIGRHLFEKYIVEIDYNERIFKLYDPNRFKNTGEGTAIPISIDNVPYMKASLVLPDNKIVEGAFMIDTGNAGCISLTSPFSSKYDMFGKIKKTIPNIGVGGAGKSDNRIGRIKGIIIDKFEINEPIISLSSDRKGVMSRIDISGLIGNEILSRFNVIFDYSHKQLILKSTGSIHNPMEYNMSGMFIYAGGYNFEQKYIYDIIPESSADEAGIKAGDQIKAIDGLDASEISIDDISNMFKQNDKHYHLEIIRNGKSFNTDLLLRRLI